MVLTRSRVRQLHVDELNRVDLGESRPRPFGRWLTEPRVVPRWVPAALVAAWVGVLAIAYALEPASAGNATPPAWGALLEVGIVGGLTVTVMGLTGRQRLGLVASVGAAGVALLGAVMCPVSGHHADVGAWWYGQMAAFVALGALSLAALRTTRRARSE